MATVKLDLISAKAQLASGKSGGKSGRAENGLFTEVFSTTLSSSRTSTAVDDRSASAAKENIDSSSKSDANTGDAAEQMIELDQTDVQELTENEDDSTDKTTAMPAWLLMQLEQDTPVAEVQTIDEMVISSPSDADISAVVDANTTAVAEDIISIIPEEGMVSVEDATVFADEMQLTADNTGDINAEAGKPTNEAGRAIIDSKLPEQEVLAAGTMPTELEAVIAQDINETAATQNELPTARQNEVGPAEAARLNIQEPSDENTDAVNTTEADTESILSTDSPVEGRLNSVRTMDVGNRHTGNEADTDTNGSAFAQMARGEAPLQTEGSVPDAVNTEAGMYSAEVEVSDVGQFGRQLIERIDLRQLDQTQQMTIRLRPDEFGSLTIRLTRSPEGLLAQLISDTAMTREMLAQQANDLQQALKNQGFDIVQTEVLSDFADQQQNSQNLDSWQQLQEGREFKVRTADAAARLSAQMLEQDEAKQIIERYTTSSVDYFA